jgi:hypothetical protein
MHSVMSFKSIHVCAGGSKSSTLKVLFQQPGLLLIASYPESLFSTQTHANTRVLPGCRCLYLYIINSNKLLTKGLVKAAGFKPRVFNI